MSSFVDSLAKNAQAVGITPGSTSYFSESSDTLDPRLFEGHFLRSWVRKGVLDLLFEFLARRYSESHRWTSAWIAGSGVSYQWAAAREPGDLDCLVGVDYATFRRLNSDYAGLSDLEISQMINEGFNEEIMPHTRNWNGYELTFYVNPATDIRDINPYAAYDLIHDSWTVEPEVDSSPPYSRMWDEAARRDFEQGAEIIKRYGSALDQVRRASNPAHRINAETQLNHAVEQASALYEDIHGGRKVAFSLTGGGYADFHNYRWQAGKRSGVVHALRAIHDFREDSQKSFDAQTYGVELPSTSTLVRRAATRRTVQ